MTVSQFNNSIVPVLVGMARLPELSNHRIHLRHVVLDLELGHFDRAIQTLDNAHAVFDLTPLSELKRFIQSQAEAITIEVNTTAWRSVVRAINGPTDRWLELTSELSPTQLLRHYIDLSPVQRAPTTEFIQDPLEYVQGVEHAPVTSRAPVVKPSKAKPSRRIPVSESRPSVPSGTRINFRAAATTFVLTLLLAIFYFGGSVL